MNTAIKKIIDYTIHVAEPESIILFGSYSRGEENKYSDLDLLVVCSNAYHRKNIERELISFSRECSMKADIIIRSKEEIETARKDPTGFINSILKEGKEVYKKTESEIKHIL